MKVYGLVIKRVFIGRLPDSDMQEKIKKIEIFPFFEWENRSLCMFCTTTDYETAGKSRTKTLKMGGQERP